MAADDHRLSPSSPPPTGWSPKSDPPSSPTRARGLDRAAVAHWAQQIAALRQQGGRQLVLVSSGAIAEGMARLGWRKRPSVMHELQAAAAVGQMGLAQAYEAAFAEYGLRTAQILLTHEDLADRRRLSERAVDAVRAAAHGRGAHRQ